METDEELLGGRGSRIDTYTMKDKKCQVTFKLAVVTAYSKGKRGKKKAINYGYVVFGIEWVFKKIFNIYRTRFEIESSYRMKNRSKPKTSSRSVKLRYFLRHCLNAIEEYCHIRTKNPQLFRNNFPQIT